MPTGYNPSVLNDFIQSQSHLQKLLTLYSQETASRVMWALKRKSGLKPVAIRRSVGSGITPFALSRILHYLRNEGIIALDKGVYYLKDDFTYSLLSNIPLPKWCSQKKEVPLVVRDNSAIFSELFFDRINNILLHMLSQERRSFKDIFRTFTDSHWYVSPNTLRYHLEKTVGICGRQVPIFEFSGGKYGLTERIEQLHAVFEAFLEKYNKDVDSRITKLMAAKLTDVADKDFETVSSTDSVKKVLHILTFKPYVLVMSSVPEGIVTMGNFVNHLGQHLLSGATVFSGLTAREIMRPIYPDDILPGDMSISELFHKYKQLEYNHYVVKFGGSYGIVDVCSLVRKLPYL